MANLQEVAKDIYFRMMGYYIVMYRKHCKELAQTTNRNEQRDEANEDGSGDVRRSKEDNSRTLEMHKDIEHVLTVFTETESTARKDENCWRVRTFNALAANASVESDND